MRGVFERPPDSGIFWINYTDAAGKRHREKVGRRSVAEQAYLQRKIEVREGKFIAPRSAGPTFAELASAQLTRDAGYLQPASREADQMRLRALLARFGELPAAKITSQQVEVFLRELVQRGRSPATANRYRSLLFKIFKFAARDGRIPKNQIEHVRRQKESPGIVRFLTEAEEALLRAVIRGRWPDRELEFDLALHTGMRRGEQYGLKRRDVDLENGILTVAGKTGKRYVQINRVARAALEKLLAEPRAAGDLLRSRGKDEHRWFERAVGIAGIRKFRWHDLRHTFASRLVMAGVEIRTVQELLGHKSIVMTMRYAHLSPAHLQASVDKLAPPMAPGGPVPGRHSAKRAVNRGI